MNEHKHIDANPVDQRTLDLLNGSIDGELNTGEKGELDKLLAGSEAIRDLNTGLRQLTGLLDAVPEREPPEYLQQAIISTVRLPVADHQNKRRGIFATWLPTHWLRTGAALAAGAVLTVGIYEMGAAPITAEDAANMVGTVMHKPMADQGVLIDTIHINTDLLDGVVELRKMEGFFVLDVQLSSDGQTEVNVDLAGRGLEFEGITRMQDHRDNVSLVNGSIQIASSGEQHYALKLRRTSAEPGQDSAAIRVEFFANNTLVHEAELRTSKQ